MDQIMKESKPDAPTVNGGGGQGSTLGLVTLLEPKLRNNVALTKETVLVLLEIEAANLTPVREGLDLVAVLDVSGSMNNDHKLSKMQRAMEFLILKLAPADRLSIVTFSSDAKKLSGLRTMNEDARQGFQDMVKGLKAGGETNIAKGLQTALAIIKRRKYHQGRTANIFLLSDGAQTHGEAQFIDSGEVPVYTFGIGRDAASELLSTIAGNSPGGTFSTVKDDAEPTKTFADLLGGTLTVVAQDVVLTLTPFKKDDPKGLEKMDVVPGLAYRPSKKEGATGTIITINFGSLFREEKRKVVVEMTLADATKPVIVLPPPADEDEDDEEEDDEERKEKAENAAEEAAQAAKATFDAILAVASLTYTAQGQSSATNGQSDKTIKVIRCPSPSSAVDSTEQEVLSEVARLQHGLLIREARVKADAGLFDEAKDELMDALNNVDNIVQDDGGKMADMLRKEVQHLLGLIKTPELYPTEGKHYAHACESSHGSQRHAGRGDGDGVRTYSTSRMDTYRQQADDFLKDSTKRPPTAEDDVTHEIAANPTAAFSSELASYLQTAIHALQAIHKIVTKTNPATTPK